MTSFDVVVIGAGAVGLACAEALAASGRSVLVVERHLRAGAETSSRNSGVVHAGLHHPPESLKTKLCRRGRQLLEQRSRAGQFELRHTGKLIVATSEGQLDRLEAIRDHALACGVEVSLLEAADVRRLEPALRVAGALSCDESGIIDVDGLLAALRRGALDRAATIAFGTRVTTLERRTDLWRVGTIGRDGTSETVDASFVVNAAGLEADRMAALAGVDVDALGLRQHFCKGTYFTVAPRAARHITRLIYPVPEQAGLGIHLTLDLDGGVRAGPDAEYVDAIDYAVDERKREQFARAVGRYLPSLAAEDLTPAYAGVRPKLAGPGEAFRDFVVRRETEQLSGLINLLGIESPGLTAALAVAELVLAHVED